MDAVSASAITSTATFIGSVQETSSSPEFPIKLLIKLLKNPLLVSVFTSVDWTLIFKSKSTLLCGGGSIWSASKSAASKSLVSVNVVLPSDEVNKILPSPSRILAPTGISPISTPLMVSLPSKSGLLLITSIPIFTASSSTVEISWTSTSISFAVAPILSIAVDVAVASELLSFSLACDSTVIL